MLRSILCTPAVRRTACSFVSSVASQVVTDPRVVRIMVQMVRPNNTPLAERHIACLQRKTG